MRCVGCSKEFDPKNLQQTRCKPKCGYVRKERNATRTLSRQTSPARFVGVDGEGVTDHKGRHHYVLLSVGDTSLHRNGLHLQWHEIFSFLYAHYRANPDSVYVGFYLGYDFTQWLRTLPAERGARLLTIAGQASRKRTIRAGYNPVPWPVECTGGKTKWEFDILAAKRMKLRPVGAKRWLYVCDTGGYFQTSFLTAIDPASWPEPVATPEEYALIVEGKKNRAVATLDANMIRYNVAENLVLAKLMRRLDLGLRSAGLTLKDNQWFGPGQVAAAWLTLVDAPAAKAIDEAVPQYARDAGQASYYGGWFEILAHGHIPGTAHEYDINSAYPYVISTLPCLLHGRWTTGLGDMPEPRHGYRLLYATVIGDSDRTGPLPYRSPEGRTYRPLITEGWYWAHEIEAAMRAGLVSSLITHEWVRYEPCPCPPPLESIAALYEQRLKVGKNSPQGRALKLVYNSAYGKFAQTVSTPKFSSGLYASLITAGCRTQILDAIATHPTGTSSLLMVATDGVYFAEEHTRLAIDPQRLGAWDHSEKTGLTLALPGIYWDDVSRRELREGKVPRLKSRGISATALAGCMGELDALWERFDQHDWPSLRIPVRFAMTSAKQAAVRGKWETAGRIVTDGDRALNTNPVLKRFPLVSSRGGLYRTTPPYGPHTELGHSLPSTPYSKHFGALDTSADVPITMDAENIDALFNWALLR